MGTENLGPAVLCCPTCPAAVQGKGTDWIENIAKKNQQKKIEETQREGETQKGMKQELRCVFVEAQDTCICKKPGFNRCRLLIKVIVNTEFHSYVQAKMMWFTMKVLQVITEISILATESNSFC